MSCARPAPGRGQWDKAKVAVPGLHGGEAIRGRSSPYNGRRVVCAHWLPVLAVGKQGGQCRPPAGKGSAPRPPCICGMMPLRAPLHHLPPPSGQFFQNIGWLEEQKTESPTYTPMATTEHTINDAIAAILRTTRYSWRADSVVSSENTGMLRGNQKRPDILVIEPNVSPVVIETEVLPATTVEKDALSRLGEQMRSTGRTILSSIAVRLPSSLKSKSGSALESALKEANDLDIAIYTGTGPSTSSRWPRSGWIKGGISDLSIFTQTASVPPDVIEKAADQLVAGVSEASGLLAELSTPHPTALQNICDSLKQQNDEQTWRMAAIILVNAFIFQESLAGGPGELKHVVSIEELRTNAGDFTKSNVLAEWHKILNVNYWPIFAIARRILGFVPADHSKQLIEALASTAEKLIENQLMRSHDLTGAVFQKLIADRKFLAAYYTTPASAALLIGLAIKHDRTPLDDSWADPATMKALKIADFACGTGTLISTAYHRISQLHELAGGNSESIHPEMMASALIGCDVLPAAAHLTASMLSGAHPTVKYNHSMVLTLPYGRQSNPANPIALGSLDLLEEQREFDIISHSAKAISGTGVREAETWVALPDRSFDLVVMNPPFTRSTGQEGAKVGVPNPMFAAFGATPTEQKLMGRRIKELTRNTSSHGNAGEASAFLVLANLKTRLSGVLALVMPLAFVAGASWEKSRKLIADRYSDLILVSIAGKKDSDMSFSADTGMGECLVVGRKKCQKERRATFVILKERPAYPMLGAVVARQIREKRKASKVNKLEDGPKGGTSVCFGDERIGQMLDVPLPDSGAWNVARIADLSLAQTAYQLANKNRCWLPTMKHSDVVVIEIKSLKDIGAGIGPYHADINFNNADGSVRGPFDIKPINAGQIPTYPALWEHDAKRENTISFDANFEGLPKTSPDPDIQTSINRKVDEIWNSASHCHFNENFRFNSQATGMQLTIRKTIGGRAWTSIIFANERHERALALWGNTTLGLLLHWWHANKEQSGRGNIGVTALKSLPVLDVTSLSENQLKVAGKLFDDLSVKRLLPFCEIDQDPVRKELDERFFGDVLGFDPHILALNGALDLVRKKLAQEPSISG